MEDLDGKEKAIRENLSSLGSVFSNTQTSPTGVRVTGIDFRAESQASMQARDDSTTIDVDRSDIVDVVVVDAENVVVEVLRGVHVAPDDRTPEKLASHIESLDEGHRAAAVETLDDYEVGSAFPWPRAKRDRLLAASDWTENPSIQSIKPPSWIERWADYRNALRDLPTTCPDPIDVAWPETP